MMLNILPPPALQGDEQAQLSQVYRYLFRLSEQLNATSAALDSQAIKASEAVIKAAGIAPAETAKADSQYSALVSLVVKTANVVQAQMDKIVIRLHSDYIAKSEWGEYEESIRREIEDTAKGTIETYIYDAKLESLSPDEVREFDTQVKGSIARGIIGFDENLIPVIGISIAQDMRKRIEYINGVPYEVIDTAKNMTTYTADKLSFWVDGAEVAYLSNSELVVTRIRVADSIQLGDWDIVVNSADGMDIRQRIGTDLDLSKNNSITLTAKQINAVAADIDLSANKSIVLTAKQVNAVANEIDLSANEYIRFVARGAEESNKNFLQAEQPTGTDLVRPGDTWTIPETGQVFQAEAIEDLALKFYLDSDGSLYYELDDDDDAITLSMQDFDLYSDGVFFSVLEDGSFGTPYVWRNVQGQALIDIKDRLDNLYNALTLDNDGVHIHKEGNLKKNEVFVDDDSVDVIVNGEKYSSFIAGGVEFGNYRIWQPAESGGLAFNLIG